MDGSKILIAERDIRDSHHQTCSQVKPEYKETTEPEKINRCLSI
jgi:hypothetical protein